MEAMTDEIITPAGTGSDPANKPQVNIEFMGDGQPAGGDSVAVDMQTMPSGVTQVAKPEATTEPSTVATPVVPVAEPAIVIPEGADSHTKARLAMEGPAYTAKREERETKEQVAEEKSKLSIRLQEIAEKKAALEETWIAIDSQRGEVKKQLEPLVKKEEEIEANEGQVEVEEKNTGLPQQKQQLEKRKWLLEDERRKLEEARWILDEKLSKIEAEIEANTTEYRKLLDEEEEIYSKLDQLSAGQV